MTRTLPEWMEPIRQLADTMTSADLSPLLPPPPDDARPAAVLLAFGEGASGPDVLLTLRAPEMRAHAGQISFPGGSIDDGDAGAIGAALRETQEETGLDPSVLDVVGTLPRLWLPPSNFAVTPVIAHWHTPADIAPQHPDEVAAVFRQPIAELMDPANRFTTVHPLGWRGPGFDIGHEVPLWGFTAGVIARLCSMLGWDRPWDEMRERPIPVAR